MPLIADGLTVQVGTAALVDQAPTGRNWVHEVKFDGYRMQVCIDRADVTLNWTHRFPLIKSAFQNLPVSGLITDGEVVSLGEGGVSNFGQLQADLSSGQHDRIVYLAFDLLFFDGFNITESPLVERKRLLKSL